VACQRAQDNATLLAVATVLGNSKKTSDSRKLKDTLSELESALTSWDKLPDQLAEAASGKSGSSDGFGSNASSALPEDMRQKTRALLNQLKEQIDELSSESEHLDN
jgi:hypothetical protein